MKETIIKVKPKPEPKPIVLSEKTIKAWYKLIDSLDDEQVNYLIHAFNRLHWPLRMYIRPLDELSDCIHWYIQKKYRPIKLDYYEDGKPKMVK